MLAISTPTLDISLFGMLHIHHSQHGIVKENRRKVQALLVWLLLEDNQAHSREQLSTLLWPEMNREAGLRNLRVALSRLKKHLTDGDALEANRQEVILHRSVSHKIDVHQFEDLIYETEKHSHDSLAGCDTCLAQLRKATDLFRGRFLDGFFLDDNEGFDEWLFVARERFHVMGLTQLGRLAQAEMVNGRLDAAETLANRQIKIDPLQESAHRLLMQIAAERGDRALALRHFQICTEMLQRELGIPPDEETLSLKKKIEAGEIASKPTHATPRQSRAPQKRNQLPQTVTPFIGRDEELALLANRLAQREYRLISLVGPGGIGKTRLAIQAAREARTSFKDGTYFVSLVGLSSSEEIPAAVADALEISLTTNGKSPADQIISFLSERELLLVVDNLEHLMEGADFLLSWLEQAPHLVIIVTSREQVNAQVEDLFRLKGLPWPADVFDLDAVKYESVRLFGDRAHRLNKRFWLNEDTLPHVVRICQQVEGLPLALELAATSIRDFDVSEIAETLIQEPELLATDLRDMPSRHRQFEAIFNYSWRLLSEEEKKTLAQLSLFAGGFTRHAARAVTGASTMTLTHLRYKSLIRADGNGRYSMHELMRQMAERKLGTFNELAQNAKKAHATFYLTWLQEKSSNLPKAASAETAQALWSEIDNIRMAWRTSVNLNLCDLIQATLSALTDMYMHFGLKQEGINQIDFVLNVLKQSNICTSNRLLAVAYLKKLSLIYKKSLFQYSDTFIEACREIFDLIIDLIKGQPNMEPIEAEARCYWANTLIFNMELDRGLEESTIALALLEKISNPILKGEVYKQHGIGCYRNGAFDQSITYFNKALTSYKTAEHLKGQASIYNRLGQAHSENANYWEALQHDKKAVELYKNLTDPQALIGAQHGLLRSLSVLGLFEEVLDVIQTFRKVSQSQKNRLGLITAETYLAEVKFNNGKFEEASRRYQTVVEQYRQADNEIFVAWALCGLNRSLWKVGRSKEALRLAEQAVQLVRSNKNIYERAETEIVAALIKWEVGQQEEALKIVHDYLPLLDPFSIMDPEKTLFEMYVVLNGADDDAAFTVLEEAHRVLDHIVHRIPDPAVIWAYLNNNIYVRWLLEAFDKHQFPPISPTD